MEMSDDRCVSSPTTEQLTPLLHLATYHESISIAPQCSVPALAGLPGRAAALLACRPAEWTVYNDIHLNVPIPQWYRDFKRLNQDHGSSAWPPKPTLNSQQPAGACCWLLLVRAAAALVVCGQEAGNIKIVHMTEHMMLCFVQAGGGSAAAATIHGGSAQQQQQQQQQQRVPPPAASGAAPADEEEGDWGIGRDASVETILAAAEAFNAAREARRAARGTAAQAAADAEATWQHESPAWLGPGDPEYAALLGQDWDQSAGGAAAAAAAGGNVRGSSSAAAAAAGGTPGAADCAAVHDVLPLCAFCWRLVALCVMLPASPMWCFICCSS